MAINLELPRKLNATVDQAHQAAAQIFRPISRKYDLREHDYPVELDTLINLFEAAAEEFTRGDYPPGCMISLAGTHCSPGMENIRGMMAEHRAFSESVVWLAIASDEATRFQETEALPAQ